MSGRLVAYFDDAFVSGFIERVVDDVVGDVGAGYFEGVLQEGVDGCPVVAGDGSVGQLRRAYDGPVEVGGSYRGFHFPQVGIHMAEDLLDDVFCDEPDIEGEHRAYLDGRGGDEEGSFCACALHGGDETGVAFGVQGSWLVVEEIGAGDADGGEDEVGLSELFFKGRGLEDIAFYDGQAGVADR